MRLPLVAVIIAAGGCATPASELTAPTPPLSMPHRREPPSPPFSADRALLADRVEEALERYDFDRWERFADAMDPGEKFADLMVADYEIREGKWRLEWLFLLGDELFEHDFSHPEGFGPGRRRVHSGAAGGPDSLSCNECHHRSGFDGAGDLSQNAFFDGDGYSAESGFERNAPHVLGLGIVQKLAEEMTFELASQRDNARAIAMSLRQTMSVPLTAKGVRFGELIVRPDGTLDTSKVVGVQHDLIVRPFGWKGSKSTIRDFVVDGLQRHHGMQTVGEALPGDGPAHDPDNDRNATEIPPGMVTTMSTYLSLLEIPVMIPPEDRDLVERHAVGWEQFHRIGCGECHRTLPLGDSKLVVDGALTVDLLVDGEAPRLRRDVFTSYGTTAFLFSDLKLHDMGPGLAESRPNTQGVPASTFLTRSLWGMADTAPYMHDGRALTIDDAILLHGGEAQTARDAFAALPERSRSDIRIFLSSLTRYPRIEFR